MMQDTGYKIQDKNHGSWFMNHASCIMHRDRDGVTLVELIIVIAIIGIIVLFATIDTAWFQRDARVTEARDRLLANLEEQKLKSITRYPHGITVPNVTNATFYTLVKLSDAAGADFKRDTGDTASIENLPAAPENPVNLPTNIRIELTGGSTEIWFDRKGMPRTSTWTRDCNCSVTTATVCADDSDCLAGETCNRTFTVWYDADGDGVRDSDEITKRISVENGGKIQYEQ
ncbi:MAG: prepilin-type N-terminal cleavage/methylation domain-containing protein [Nitrospirota bacterium]|nr:prepilin-type N-terminal cleavage/methylation domain-containing protein [Nitrospirota bacterium]